MASDMAGRIYSRARTLLCWTEKELSKQEQGDSRENTKVKDCWANCLGDCRGKISGEHIITEKIRNSNEIGVLGLPWCRTKHQFIGVASFTKNMLCERHNSTVSPVDEGGIAAFDAFRHPQLCVLQALSGSDNRTSMSSSSIALAA
jgi:hypothetical protein